MSSFSSKFIFQIEVFSGINKYGRSVHLACLIVRSFLFFNIYNFCGKQVLLNLGKVEVAVNVVECDFDFIGRIFILQN